VAQAILETTKRRIAESEVTPGLGVILVGDDAPSHLYVGIKERRAVELGIYFEKKVFDASASAEEIKEAIEEMNENPRLHGIIVQVPLPAHLDADDIIAAIDPAKDTDGFHPETIAKFLAGDASRLPVFPRAMIELVRAGRKGGLSGGGALVLVNSSLIGKVLEKALTDEGYQTKSIIGEGEFEVGAAEIVLTALGEPGVVSSTEAKSGSVWIDGGISYDINGKVVGDIARDDGVYQEDILVTPVPGGVGPVTVAVLLARVTEAAFFR
jgi:methylenetetrahydrofolate dehydrogenase (NADP+)/methenyltetrahydrofolate cyclohydrolase